VAGEQPGAEAQVAQQVMQGSPPRARTGPGDSTRRRAVRFD
jgi:hypothetical protein